MVLSACEPGTPVAKPAAEIPDEIGATIADARRLARKATRISVFYSCGSDRKDCIGLKPAMFLSRILHKDAADPMPCWLHTYTYSNGDLDITLMVGV